MRHTPTLIGWRKKFFEKIAVCPPKFEQILIIMRYLISFLLLIATIVAQAQNQKPFEGEITFKLEIEGGGEEMELARQFMPSGFLYLLKGNNVMIKTLGANAAMTGDVVFNAKNNTAFLLQPTARIAYLMKDVAKADENSEEVHQLPVVRTGTTPKTIGGYKCKHYIITNPQDESGQTELWVSDEIMVNMPHALGNNMPIDQKIMSVVKGFPLAMKMDGPDGLKISLMATTVEKKPISSSLFEIPKGFEVKNFEPGSLLPGGGQ